MTGTFHSYISFVPDFYIFYSDQYPDYSHEVLCPVGSNSAITSFSKKKLKVPFETLNEEFKVLRIIFCIYVYMYMYVYHLLSIVSRYNSIPVLKSGIHNTVFFHCR